MDRRKILLVVAVVVAALGAALVFVYANGAESRAQDEEAATVEVYVAKETLVPGETIASAAKAGKLGKLAIPATEQVGGSSGNDDDFLGKLALTTIYPGEQLLTQKFGTIDDIEAAATLPLPKGKTAITLELTDAGRVGSFTKPGAHVAVYFTPFMDTGSTDGTDGTDGSDTPDNVVQITPACVIEEDLLVLGVGSNSVDQPVIGEDGTTPTDTVAVTLLTVAVDSEQASTLIGFQTASAEEDRPTLTFALRNDESKVENTAICNAYLTQLQQGGQLSGGTSDSDDTANG